MRGGAAGDYRAPLFFAWQLTNRCGCRCLHCCEESGPTRAWPDELTRKECLRIAGDLVACGIPYVAFGGGEPLGAPHVWEVLGVLRRGGVCVKIETTGESIDARAAAALARLGIASIQISLDGPSAAAHRALRPGADFDAAVAALERLVARGLGPEVVFIPTKLNAAGAGEVFDLAARIGVRVFATGPLMRLGRAGAAWKRLALAPAEWRRLADSLRARSVRRPGGPKLSIYPFDIQGEIASRLASPQAMMLVVPNGKVKLLNALPFAPADLRRHSLAEAWDRCLAAWRTPEVRGFCRRVRREPGLLAHANECWKVTRLPRGEASS